MKISSNQNNQKPALTKYDTLSHSIEQLTRQLEKRENARKEEKIRRQEELNELYQSMEEKSNRVVSKIEDLTKKPSIVLEICKVSSDLPENFPKNYYIQVIYQDVTVIGNEKLLQLDTKIINEPFVLPLLSSENVRIQIWGVQEQPLLYDRCTINLQSAIQQILGNKNYVNQVRLQLNELVSLEYRIKVQGIGFSSWLKNIRNIREGDQQRKKTKMQIEMQMNSNRQKIAEKKKEFFRRFEENGGENKTKQYDLKGIQEILSSLND